MFFEYTSCIYVDDGELEEMKELVREGKDPAEVYTDWADGLDDNDYYEVEKVKDSIIKALTSD